MKFLEEQETAKKTDNAGPFMGDLPCDNHGYFEALHGEVRQDHDKYNQFFLDESSADARHKIGLQKWVK